MTLPPERWLVLLLLVLGGVGHALALLSLRRGRQGAARWLAAAAQLLLLAAMTGAGLLALGTNVWQAWLPTQAEPTIEVAGWLALTTYLIAGYWWRSPGLGVTLPPLLVLLLVVPMLTRDASATRGLLIGSDLRPAYGVISAAVLACAVLAVAGLLARRLEGRLLGQPVLARRVPTVLLTLATLLLSGQVALAASAWSRRSANAPVWTVQQTWLLASWLVVLLATGAGWRGWRPWGPLVGLAAGLLLIRLAVVAAVP